jgi:hypothetical protein
MEQSVTKKDDDKTSTTQIPNTQTQFNLINKNNIKNYQNPN